MNKTDIFMIGLTTGAFFGILLIDHLISDDRDKYKNQIIQSCEKGMTIKECDSAIEIRKIEEEIIELKNNIIELHDKVN